MAECGATGSSNPPSPKPRPMVDRRGARFPNSTGSDDPWSALSNADDCSRQCFPVEPPTLDEPAPLRNRPAIYLDQNAWSMVSRVVRGDRELIADQRAASERLIEPATNWKSVFPFSTGTLTE